MNDKINHPQHYNQLPNGIECIDVIEHFSCCPANAIKYIWRAGLKGDAITDYKKAIWYLEREIERLEKEQVKPVFDPDGDWIHCGDKHNTISISGTYDIGTPELHSDKSNVVYACKDWKPNCKNCLVSVMCESYKTPCQDVIDDLNMLEAITSEGNSDISNDDTKWKEFVKPTKENSREQNDRQPEPLSA